jgi:phospholipid/cholesterol/gamma-HCH transport system permease protein
MGIKSMKRTPRPQDFELTLREGREGELRLAVTGTVTLYSLNALMSAIRARCAETAPAELVLEMDGVTYLDSAGAMALSSLRAQPGIPGMSVRLDGLSPAALGVFALVDTAARTMPPMPPERESDGFFGYLGEMTVKILDDFVLLMIFLGELLLALYHATRQPRSVRWGDVLFYMKRTGVDGLPIVSLISLLVGLIMAFMSSLQLKPFGANVYVASLVGLVIVKEMGPIMTAIIVAGRSGSAFAAEIGTMIVNEEVDALTSMGFDPIRFLALPKVLAAMLTVPLLTVYSMFWGIGGGLMVGVLGLNLTVHTYVQETLKSLSAWDVVSSLLKSVVFAILIAGIGCQRGFQVRGGAESVGAATTSAVVSAIFLVVVADSTFAIVLSYI